MEPGQTADERKYAYGSKTLDISGRIDFLLSDEAGFITGACLDVNGGRQTY